MPTRISAPSAKAEGESLAGVSRPETGFKDKDEFLANAVFAGKREKMTGIRELLGQNSSYFLLQAEVEVAGRNMRLYSVLDRSNRKISAIARASGSL